MKKEQTPKYALQPFVGLTVVSFGMTQAQVAKALGKPDETKPDDVMGLVREIRDGVEFEYWYEDKKKLAAVHFPKGTSLFYDDQDLMNTKDVLELLKTRDPKWKDNAGYMCFPKLGLTMGGFGKRRIPEGKLVIAWGRLKADMYTILGSV
jgi:hypothetical protein